MICNLSGASASRIYLHKASRKTGLVSADIAPAKKKSPMREAAHTPHLNLALSSLDSHTLCSAQIMASMTIESL